MKIKVGDIVKTRKGCRINGPSGDLVVIKLGLRWGRFEAVECLKPNGKKGRFLVKNLEVVNEDN